MRPWFVLSVILAVTLAQGACKKKPNPEEGSAQGAKPTLEMPAALQPGEGLIRWPIADLRDTPGGAVMAKLKQGARVAVLERREGWTKVRSIEGKSEGWVPGDAVEGGVAAAAGEPMREAAAPAQVRIAPKRANLRDAARGRILAKVLRGTVLRVLREEGDWLEVEGEGKKGWIARQVVTPVVPARPAGGAESAKPVLAKGLGTATVRWNSLNLREEPDGKVLTQLSAGSKLAILSIEPGWLRVQTPEGKQGWVVDRAVTREGSAPAPVVEPPIAPVPTAVAQGTIRWSKLNVRAKPPKGKVITTLVRGGKLDILGREGKWLKVRAGEHEGWVAAGGVAEGGPVAAPVAATAPLPSAPAMPTELPMKQVIWTSVNLRETPSTSSKVADKLARGTRLRQMETDGDWVKVQTLDAQRTGWVTKRSLGAAR